jgi:hypothetical protein
MIPSIFSLYVPTHHLLLLSPCSSRYSFHSPKYSPCQTFPISIQFCSSGFTFPLSFAVPVSPLKDLSHLLPTVLRFVSLLSRIHSHPFPVSEHRHIGTPVTLLQHNLRTFAALTHPPVSKFLPMASSLTLLAKYTIVLVY